jgi:hypothetical protein
VNQAGRFVAAIRRRRPRMLFGYPSALSLVANAEAEIIDE